MLIRHIGSSRAIGRPLSAAEIRPRLEARPEERIAPVKVLMSGGVCQRHKKYRAVRKPQCDCPVCWQIWRDRC